MKDEEQKIYRVRYEDGSTPAIDQYRGQFPERTEQLSSESEVLTEELLGAGVHHGIVVLDEGKTLFGLRLDLKLGTNR